jgi:hypothetical protein
MPIDIADTDRWTVREKEEEKKEPRGNRMIGLMP